MKSVLRFACAAIPCTLVLFVFVGCGGGGKVPGLVQLEGIVTYQGEPLADARINFHPTDEGRGAYASTDASGRFRATTIDPDDGIVKGQYRVTISKYETVRYIRHADGGDEPVAANKLPAKYSGTETPLTIDVTGRKLDVRFELVD
jgi:hypothetical protein